MDPQLKELLEQFNKLKVAFGKKEYGRCTDLLPLLDKDLSKVLKTSHYHCPDLDPRFDPYEGLEGEVPIPKDAFEEFEDTIQPVEDRVSEKLSEARLHASEAFRLVKGTLSVTMNQASQNHLHACQVEIQVSIKALIEASLRLSDAVVAQASD